MEGFYGQIMYGCIRYWPNVSIFTSDPTTVPLYQWQLTQGEKPEVLTEWAAAGELQPIWGFGFPFPAGALVAGWIPGLGRPTYDAENDIWRVKPPTPITRIYQWSPGGYEEISIDRDRSRPWRLVIKNANNSTLANITSFWDARVVSKIDEAGELQFRCRYQESFRVHLTGANFIWLYDGFGLLRDKYQIMRVKRIRDGDSRIVEVQCLSMIARLSREPVESYTTPVVTRKNAAGKIIEERRSLPARTVLQQLLNLQQNSGPRIHAGNIDSGIANYPVRYAVDDTTIYDALRGLQLLLPTPLRGMFTVDATNRLNWNIQAGPQRLRMDLGRELRGIEYSLDYSDLVTRLYLYGQAQDTERPLSLMDAGWPYPYMSRNTSLYGVVALRKQDNRIKYPETLINVARRILEDYSEPLLELRVDAIELSKSDTALSGNFVDIVPGSQYRIVDAGMGIDTTVHIIQCEYNVADPLAVRLQLKNRTRRLSDVFASLIKQLNPRIPMDRMAASLTNNDRMRDNMSNHVLNMFDRAIANALLENPEYYADQLRERVTEIISKIVERIVTESVQNDAFDTALEEHLNTLTTQYQGLAQITMAKIASIDDNMLSCYLWDAETSNWTPRTYNVFKPYLLQRWFYDGSTVIYENGQRVLYFYINSYTRSAIDMDTQESETQEITPNYFIDDIILIGRSWTGSAYSLFDLNCAGRTWAKIEAS